VWNKQEGRTRKGVDQGVKKEDGPQNPAQDSKQVEGKRFAARIERDHTYWGPLIENNKKVGFKTRRKDTTPWAEDYFC